MKSIWIAGGLGALVVYSKIKAALALEYDFGLPYNYSVSLAKLEFTQPVILINRTSTPLLIQLVDLAFSTPEGLPLGTAYVQGQLVIPAQTAATLPVQVRGNISDLLRAFPEARQQVGAKKIVVRYAGTIQAEHFTLPVSELFEWDFPSF